MSADHSKCTPVVIDWGDGSTTDSCSCTVDRYRALCGEPKTFTVRAAPSRTP